MSFFNLLNILAAFLVPIYNLLYFKQKRELLSEASGAAIRHFAAKPQRGITKLLSGTAFWTVIEIYVISSLQYIFMGFLNTIVGNLFDTGANYFGMIFFAPLFVVAFCLIVKIDLLAQMDLITPAYPLALTVSKIACYFAGCCRGVRWIYGFYNPVSRAIEFPAQLLEAAVAFLLFLFLQCFRKKFKKGTVFPIYLTAFSGIRFFTEFLRCEPEVLWGLKTYHFFCIVGVVLGVIEYMAARRYDARMQEKAENPHISA